MTGLLVGTFVVGGAHTLLWLPRAFQMRRELKAEEEAEEREAERPRCGPRGRRKHFPGDGATKDQGRS